MVGIVKLLWGKLLKRKTKFMLLIATCSVFLVVALQNCGPVKIGRFEGQNSLSAQNIDLGFPAPTEYAWNRRYIFLVDMSYSMVSGPCPFDVNVSESTHGFTGAYKDYDPNFPQDGVNFSDARARVADCSVDQNLAFGQMTLDYGTSSNSSFIPNHKTFKGSDFDYNRLKVIRSWLQQMRSSNNTEFLERTQVLILPAAGGIAFSRLMTGYPTEQKFLSLTDSAIDTALDYLEEVHKETRISAELPPADRFLLRDPHLDKLKMGTTFFASAYDKAFQLIDADMESSAKAGSLTNTTYKFISFTDQRINPLPQHLDKSISLFDVCVDCRAELEKAWGKPNADELANVDLKLSLVQGLTKYYGSGYFESEFIDLQALEVPEEIKYIAQEGANILVGTEYPTPQVNVIEYLNSKSFERKAYSKVYKQSSDKLPYQIVTNTSGVTTFKVTNIFILNSNFKVNENGKGLLDTDGDGLADEIEVQTYNTNPANARSNLSCLDSITIEPGYKTRCETLASSGLCNAKVDSDGDGLNECEELTVGTDPYDFDTEGDGVPDSLELLYNMNPLADDAKSDANGDGLSNLMNFDRGLNPLVTTAQVDNADQIIAQLNFTGTNLIDDNLLGKVKTDQFNINLINFPLRRSELSPLALEQTYLIKPGVSGYNPNAAIRLDHMLLQPIFASDTNSLLGLARVIDPDEPTRVYWQIFKINMDVKNRVENFNVNLSNFSQIRVMDRVRNSK